MNPHRGDIALVVGDKTYTVRYTHSALVKLETQLNKGLYKLMQELTDPENMRVGTVAAMLWAGLQKHHGKMSIEEAIELLDDIEGGMPAVVEILGEAFQRAFNAPGTKGTNPQQQAATNGTGMPLSSTSSAMDTIPSNFGTSPRAK